MANGDGDKNEISNMKFAEWRGAVMVTLNYIKEDLSEMKDSICQLKEQATQPCDGCDNFKVFKAETNDRIEQVEVRIEEHLKTGPNRRQEAYTIINTIFFAINILVIVYFGLMRGG